MKKLLYLATLAVMGVSLLPLHSQAFFSDVPGTHPNTEAIVYAQNEGIVEGYSDGTFKPDATINRAEFVKIAAETFDSKENLDRCTAAPSVNVKDVPSTEWYAKYVCAASSGHGNGSRNPVQGNPDGTFRPGQPVNFVEAAKIISIYTETRMLERREAENNPDLGGLFTAPVGSDQWYAKYVAYLDEVNAIPLTIVKPSQAITRGEMAEMIYRIKTGNQNKPSQRFVDLENGTIIPAAHIDMIYNYFRFLENDSTLQQAYVLRAEKDMDFDTFKSAYGNVAFTSIYSINKTAESTYSFYGLIAERNGERKLYKMEMMVTAQNQLKTVLSSELSQETIETYDLNATNDAEIKMNYDRGSIVLTYYAKGVQSEVDRIDLSKSFVSNGDVKTYFNSDFKNVLLSSDGRFLTYILATYEGSPTKVYDLVSKREVSSVAGLSLGGFTSDKKYYYACSSYDYGDTSNVFIYTSPDFTRQVLTLSEKTFDCTEYDRKSNTLTFTSMNTSGTPAQHIFDFSTGKLR